MFYSYIDVYPGSFLDAVGSQTPGDGKDPFWCLRLLDAICVISETTIYSSLRQGT